MLRPQAAFFAETRQPVRTHLPGTLWVGQAMVFFSVILEVRCSIRMTSQDIFLAGNGCAILFVGKSRRYNVRYTYGEADIGCPAGYEQDPTSGQCRPKGKAAGKPNPNSCAGNPISINIGNKFQAETDFAGVGEFPLIVKRAFNSSDNAWQFMPEIIPAGPFGGTVVVRAGGKKLSFYKHGDVAMGTEPDNTGNLETFYDGQGNITGWRYTTLDNHVEDYDASGKVLSITNRASISHAYVHTATDITVTHSNGAVLVYGLDGSGKITGFTSPDNKTYTYSYDGSGRLTGITYPDNGGTRQYHYEDTNFPNSLTGITDANGDRFATWTYDSLGRAISSQHYGGAELVTVDYTYLYDATDPQATITNALGKQTTYHL